LGTFFYHGKSEVLMNIEIERQHASQVIDELYENTFFQRYWRAIGRFIGRGKQASIWVSAAIVMSTNLLLGVAISALLGETQFTTMKAILVNLMWATYGFLLIPIFISINTRMVEFLRLRFIKSLQDESHIKELLRWASQWFGNHIAQLFISLGFGIAIALLTFYSIYPSTKFSIGQTLIYFICFFHVAVAVYSLLSLLAFASMLDKLSLALYSDDPASTPILLQLSKQLRDYILVLAFAGAGLLLLDGLVGTLNIVVILITLVVDWIPILALFVLGNRAFSQQIVRVKYERLEKLQSQIMELSNAEKSDKDTTAHIKSLIDYHDRVKSSRNSLYSTESFINLIGSLALPLLGATLSIIDVWQKIFGKP
jgi:hypothetical protein